MSGPHRKQRSAPLSVRFTDAEKARLRELAGNTPLGVFIPERALGDGTEPRARVRQPVKDGEALGRLLALLGQSRIANNLNQLAKAVNQGSLPVTVEVEADLRAACAAVWLWIFAVHPSAKFFHAINRMTRASCPRPRILLVSPRSGALAGRKTRAY